MLAVGALSLVSGASALLVGSPLQPGRHAATRTAPVQMSDIWTPSSRGEPGQTPRDKAFGPLGQYCPDLYEIKRRTTRTVECGPVNFGSEHPIVRQTMATTLTSDVEGSVEQIIKCADEGFDLVRVTVVGMKDAKACLKIREGLDARGYDIPLCADMHFQPKVALVVADAVEKIRINPGNFVDGRKDFEEKIYETEDDFIAEREFFIEAFTPLVKKCKELNRAMRIGTNHGSLSSRILSFYGDTPRGMVESAIEFADICRSLDYHNFVFSMKASNPLVMVQGEPRQPYRCKRAERPQTERPKRPKTRQDGTCPGWRRATRCRASTRGADPFAHPRTNPSRRSLPPARCGAISARLGLPAPPRRDRGWRG